MPPRQHYYRRNNNNNNKNQSGSTNNNHQDPMVSMDQQAVTNNKNNAPPAASSSLTHQQQQHNTNLLPLLECIASRMYTNKGPAALRSDVEDNFQFFQILSSNSYGEDPADVAFDLINEGVNSGLCILGGKRFNQTVSLTSTGVDLFLTSSKRFELVGTFMQAKRLSESTTASPPIASLPLAPPSPRTTKQANAHEKQSDHVIIDDDGDDDDIPAKPRKNNRRNKKSDATTAAPPAAASSSSNKEKKHEQSSPADLAPPKPKSTEEKEKKQQQAEQQRKLEAEIQKRKAVEAAALERKRELDKVMEENRKLREKQKLAEEVAAREAKAKQQQQAAEEAARLKKKNEEEAARKKKLEQEQVAAKRKQQQEQAAKKKLEQEAEKAEKNRKKLEQEAEQQRKLEAARKKQAQEEEEQKKRSLLKTQKKQRTNNKNRNDGDSSDGDEVCITVDLRSALSTNSQKASPVLTLPKPNSTNRAQASNAQLKKNEEEAARKKKSEEEAKRKQQQEEQAQKQKLAAEEDARKKQLEKEAAQKRRIEEAAERKRKVEQDVLQQKKLAERKQIADEADRQTLMDNETDSRLRIMDQEAAMLAPLKKMEVASAVEALRLSRAREKKEKRELFIKQAEEQTAARKQAQEEEDQRKAAEKKQKEKQLEAERIEKEKVASKKALESQISSHLKNGEYNSATKLFNEYLIFNNTNERDTSSSNPNEALATGLDHLKNNRCLFAAMFFTLAIDSSKSTTEQTASALVNRSRCHFYFSHFNLAFQDANRCCELRPEWPEGWKHRALSSLKVPSHTKSNINKTALESFKKYFELVKNSGDANESERGFKKMKSEFEAVLLNLESEKLSTIRNVEAFILRNHQYSEALISLDHIAELMIHLGDQTSIEDQQYLRQTRARVFLKTGETKKALKEAEQLISQFPSFSVGYRRAAEVCEAMKDLEKACEFAEKCVKNHQSKNTQNYSRDRNYREELSLKLFEKKIPDMSSAELLKRGIAETHDEYFNCGAMLLETFLEKSDTSTRDTIQALMTLAVCEEGRKNFRSMFKYADRASTISPSCLAMKGKAAFYLADWQLATECFDEMCLNSEPKTDAGVTEEMKKKAAELWKEQQEREQEAIQRKRWIQMQESMGMQMREKRATAEWRLQHEQAFAAQQWIDDPMHLKRQQEQRQKRAEEERRRQKYQQEQRERVSVEHLARLLFRVWKASPLSVPHHPNVAFFGHIFECILADAAIHGFVVVVGPQKRRVHTVQRITVDPSMLSSFRFDCRENNNNNKTSYVIDFEIEPRQLLPRIMDEAAERRHSMACARCRPRVIDSSSSDFKRSKTEEYCIMQHSVFKAFRNIAQGETIQAPPELSRDDAKVCRARAHELAKNVSVLGPSPFGRWKEKARFFDLVINTMFPRFLYVHHNDGISAEEFVDTLITERRIEMLDREALEEFGQASISQASRRASYEAALKSDGDLYLSPMDDSMIAARRADPQNTTLLRYVAQASLDSDSDDDDDDDDDEVIPPPPIFAHLGLGVDLRPSSQFYDFDDVVAELCGFSRTEARILRLHREAERRK